MDINIKALEALVVILDRTAENFYEIAYWNDCLCKEVCDDFILAGMQDGTEVIRLCLLNKDRMQQICRQLEVLQSASKRLYKEIME